MVILIKPLKWVLASAISFLYITDKVRYLLVFKIKKYASFLNKLIEKKGKNDHEIFNQVTKSSYK